jgi:hypothetical protein
MMAKVASQFELGFAKHYEGRLLAHCENLTIPNSALLLPSGSLEKVIGRPALAERPIKSRFE